VKILFILDPLKELNVHYDSSLEMVRTFTRMGHTCYFALAKDLIALNGHAFASSRRIQPKARSLHFKLGLQSKSNLKAFEAVLVRKEPPFNMAYIYMTYILDLAAKKTVVLNHPTGIRDANEKFACMDFPGAIPSTLVSSSLEEILSFQTKSKKDLILKPLDERGGRGITVLKQKLSSKEKRKKIAALTGKNQTPIIAQHFISRPGLISDKRVFLLDGKFLAAYERTFAQGDFRGNLSQGASHQKTVLTPKETKAIKQISPWLKRKGLHFVGLDFLDGRLLEINVTCPGGFPEAGQLYPELKVFEKFVNSVERKVRKFRN